MSGPGLGANTDTELVDGVMAALRADSALQEKLGNPARVFDHEAPDPIFPYVILERHERYDRGASHVDGAEHRLTLATNSRHDGLSEAKSILSALRAAVDQLDLNLSGQRIVLAHTTYADAMRTRDRRKFRGLLRVRIITEEA